MTRCTGLGVGTDSAMTPVGARLRLSDVRRSCASRSDRAPERRGDRLSRFLAPGGFHRIAAGRLWRIKSSQLSRLTLPPNKHGAAAPTPRRRCASGALRRNRRKPEPLFANRADGLVNQQDQRGGLGASEPRQCSAGLAGEDFIGAPTVAIRQRFADADKGNQAVTYRRFDLETDCLIGLAKMLASLGMAEFDEIEAAVLEHRRRNLARPCARVRSMHVLRSHLHRSRRESLFDLAHAGEWGNDETLHARVCARASVRH